MIPLVTASEQGKAQACNPAQPPFSGLPGGADLVRGNCGFMTDPRPSAVSKVLSRLEWHATEGDSPVRTDSRKGDERVTFGPTAGYVTESGCLRVQPESGWYTPPKAKYTVGDR